MSFTTQSIVTPEGIDGTLGGYEEVGHFRETPTQVVKLQVKFQPFRLLVLDIEGQGLGQVTRDPFYEKRECLIYSVSTKSKPLFNSPTVLGYRSRSR